ncbi:hypothetical protein [Polymorphospora rubra]|uniref:Secreted protein n=1 Tax=Polymorphospora rubra TaxID=338584 RepID=A0A810MX20_9ACTN|nr:hypothetical protein [Polymorphospora rubra]BCJ63955.1 hypothetical protein Prubr_09760 [Polymorphospora rubra]
MNMFATYTRKALLATAGIALTAGLAGPTSAALAAEPTPTQTVAVAQTIAQTADTPGAPTVEQLMPAGVPDNQSSFTPNAEQLDNARKIIDAGKDMNLPPRAWTIAIATALQESKLENLGHLGDRNDHDSQGLFQQRPSSGWGTVEQITDPDYSAKAFYKGLAQVDGWEDMPLTVAAQTVQVSAYPDHYAQWEKMAADIITDTTK